MLESFGNKNAIVIDNGSGMIKAGLAGYDSPTAVFPTIIGRPRSFDQTNEFFVGEEALAKKGILNIKYPINRGVVNDFDDMEKIWHHCFSNELRKQPEEYPCMLTDSLWNMKNNREKIVRMMFEGFNVPFFYLKTQEELSLYATGRITGIVIDSGDGVTKICPIQEGHLISYAAKKIDFAGRDLTEYLMRMLSEIGLNYQSSSEKEIIRNIKEYLCYVALDPKKEAEAFNSLTNLNKSFELPDGKIVTLNDQQYRCPELLFNPNLIRKDFEGIHTLAFYSIMKCDADVRNELYNNIILSGGTTMLPGIAKRLSKEIRELAPSSVEVEVYAQPDRKYLVWVGGSIITSLAPFQTMWITKAEYDESGPAIVHKKCF